MRLKPTSEIKSRTEFDHIIDQTVQLQITKERMELKRDQTLLDVRKTFDGEITDLAEKMQANVLRAEKYAEQHRDELLPTRAKTSETKFAFFGFRMGNPTLVLLGRKWTWGKVIQAMKASSLWQYIITVEHVDKDAVKTQLDAPTLAAIGTRIEQKESFFIDPKRDPADPHRLVAEPKLAA